MQLRSFGFLVVAAILIAACGSSKTSTPSADAGPAKKDSAVAPKTDAGPTKKDAGPKKDAAVASTTITCAAKTCTAPRLDLSSLIAAAPAQFAAMITPSAEARLGYAPEVCCNGTAKDKCGVTNATIIPDGTCEEQNQPGKTTTLCPTENMTFSVPTMGALPVPMKGCCKPSNKCGVDVSLMGAGCVQRTEMSRIQRMAKPTGDAAVPVALLDINCDYASIVVPTDAGTHDASTHADAGH